MSGSTLEKSANAMTNLPYFDFNLAIEDYGLDFQEFSADGFSAFLEETYLDNFIQLRKNFINKDFSKVRFYAHKFKGVFHIIQSSLAYESCYSLQVAIDKIKDFNEIIEEYNKVVYGLIKVLQQIVTLANTLKISINEEKLSRFWKSNQECDELQNKEIKINSNKAYSKNDDDNLSNSSKDTCVEFSSTKKDVRCNICVIF